MILDFQKKGQFTGKKIKGKQDLKNFLKPFLFLLHVFSFLDLRL